MYKPYKIPCGTAIAHACSQILWFTKGSLLDEKGDEKSSTYSDPVGNVVNVRVEKNKVTKMTGDWTATLSTISVEWMMVQILLIWE